MKKYLFAAVAVVAIGYAIHGPVTVSAELLGQAVQNGAAAHHSADVR